jgi:hypothetical protein
MSLKNRKKPHVLYFTEEANLTAEQQAELDSIPGGRHRNAALVDPDAPLEQGVTGVAGPAVPENYAHLPHIEGTVDETEEEEESEAEGDDYEAMTVPQLKKLLDDAEVEYPATAKKAALVALAQEHLTEEE